VGAESFHANRQTDVTKRIIAFRNFANAPENDFRKLNRYRTMWLGYITVSRQMFWHNLKVSLNLHGLYHLPDYEALCWRSISVTSIQSSTATATDLGCLYLLELCLIYQAVVMCGQVWCVFWDIWTINAAINWFRGSCGRDYHASSRAQRLEIPLPVTGKCTSEFMDLLLKHYLHC
jgi:hypothetical protein